MTRHRTKRWWDKLQAVLELEKRWKVDREALIEAVADLAADYRDLPLVERCLVKQVAWPRRWGRASHWVARDANDAQAGTVVSEAAEGYLLTMLVFAPRLRRNYRNWGALRASDLPTAGFFPKDLAVYLTRSRNPPSSVVAGGLIVFPGALSMLARRATKTLLALGPTPVADVARWIGADPKLCDLSPDEVERILRRHEDFEVQGDEIALAPGKAPSIVLTPNERLLLALFRERGGVVGRETYVYEMRVRGGVKVPLASALLRAPFVRRLQRGVYALRGVRIGASEAHAVKEAQDEAFRGALVRFERDGDRMECWYEMSVPALQRGTVPLPDDARLPSRDWEAYMPDETVAKLRVRSGSLGGLGPWLRRAGYEVGSRFSMEFLFDDAAIYVYAGGPAGGAAAADGT